MADFEEYYPGPVPQSVRDLGRYVDYEFQRVSALKEPRFAGAIFSIGWSDTILIEDAIVPTWQRLTDPGDTPELAYPDGIWDGAAGTIVAPYDGFYRVTVGLNTQNVGGSGNRAYFMGAAIEADWTSGAPANPFIDQKLNNENMIVSASAGGVFSKGQTIDVVVAAWSDQFTIVADINAYIDVTREY